MLEIIEVVESLLGGFVDEVEAKYYISKATTLVRNYLNDDITDEVILTKHKDAITELVYRSFSAKKNKTQGVKSITQGQRSVTYSDNASNPFVLDDEVKALLPLPKVRFF